MTIIFQANRAGSVRRTREIRSQLVEEKLLAEKAPKPKPSSTRSSGCRGVAVFQSQLPGDHQMLPPQPLLAPRLPC